MRGRRTTPTSATNSAPAMPTTPIGPNMACAIIAAAGGRARAKPRAAWRRARLRAKFSNHLYKKVIDARRAGADGHAKDRPRALGLGGGREESVLLPGRQAVAPWTEYLEAVRKKGSSCGAIIEVVAEGIPAGLGAPIYGKLDADLAGAHDEHQCGQGRGDRRRLRRGDALRRRKRRRDAQGTKGAPKFLSNHAGGILGGISTGQPIVARFAVKPTSSILTPRKTIDVDGNETEIQTKGRHDPCVGIRAVPVGEAMMACVLADHALRHRAQMG